jgi:hypothetical protein
MTPLASTAATMLPAVLGGGRHGLLQQHGVAQPGKGDGRLACSASGVAMTTASAKRGRLAASRQSAKTFCAGRS